MLVDLLNAQSPTIPGLRRGKPGTGEGLPVQMIFDTKKTESVLGIKWKTAEDIAKELIHDWRRRNWKGGRAADP